MQLSFPEGPKETSVIFYKHQEDLIQVPQEAGYLHYRDEGVNM